MIIPLVFTRWIRRIRRVLKSLILYSLIMFLAILFIGALAIYLVEHPYNPGIRNYFDAVWFIMETITTVGYGDIVPVTFWGKVVDMVIMPLGIAVISILTASIAGELTNMVITRSLGQHVSSRRNHIVVIGCVNRALKVIEELMRMMEREGLMMDLTYLHNGDKPTSLPSDVEFLRGNPFNTNDLLRAGVDRASTVIITPLGENSSSSDAEAILITMRVRELNKDAYIITEVLDEANRDYAFKAGANSVVSLGSFTTTIIAREALSRGTSSVLMRIINDGKVSLVKAEGYVGLRFIEVVEKLKTTENRLIIGVVRSSDILINPSNDLIIQPGDLLITVS